MRNCTAINHNFYGIITYLTRICLAALLIISIQAKGQDQISLEYNLVELREEFSAKNENWPYLTTMENLYVVDKDEYFMHRRNKSASYAIVTDWRNKLSQFNILTTLKLGPSNDENQTIGVIFLIQEDGQGAVVFEFNKFKQYRIKQLVGSYYKFLSGDAESNGWVKSGALAGKNDYNEINLSIDLPKGDVYVNEKFLQSLDVIDYKPGGMGFLIGPDTKAKSDYFYVYTTAEGKQVAEEQAKEEKDNRSAVQQLSKLRYELEQEKRALKECELERQRAVTVLEEQMGLLTQNNERLTLQNRQLKEFKSQVLVEIDEDVFLTLAENLKEEIIKNQKLESQVQVYKDSLSYAHSRYNKLKLALLDKAIKKAEKDKIARDKKDAEETKKAIEQELEDKKMKKEQANWEAKNQASSSTEKPVEESKVALAEELIEEALEEFDNEPDTAKTSPVSEKEVSEEKIEARPLPAKVRKAQKKQD